MKLDKLNPTGYDAYMLRKWSKDRRWAKKVRGMKREAVKTGN